MAIQLRWTKSFVAVSLSILYWKGKRKEKGKKEKKNRDSGYVFVISRFWNFSLRLMKCFEFLKGVLWCEWEANETSGTSEKKGKERLNKSRDKSREKRAELMVQK